MTSFSYLSHTFFLCVSEPSQAAEELKAKEAEAKALKEAEEKAEKASESKCDLQLLCFF